MITKNIDVVYMFVVILVIVNIMASGLALIIGNKLQKLTTLPRNQLVPIILVICLVGAFVINRRLIDVVIALIAGLVGYYMKKFGYSRVAFIIALVLGTFVERYFHLSIRLFGPLFIFQRPVAMAIMILILISLFMPFVQGKFKRKRSNSGEK